MTKKILLKYKDISILISETVSLELFIENRKEIENLNSKVRHFHKNIVSMGEKENQEIEHLRVKLKDISEEFEIIGSPFDNHDAELYALNNRIEYEILELV